MITFMDSKEKSEEVDRCLDPQLWHACAGGMVQMPAVNTKVYYFPQGHAEHACGPVNFRNCPKVPPLVPCRVASIKYMADPETDEVYAKLRLVPLNSNDADYDRDVVGGINGPETQDKPLSFAKTLTQSDANNGGGFSVPRYCAETIFPRLDYSADPPVQNILAKDVHGETWKFRHIYRGTPRRHLLTTGWSTFVNHKKLIAGDSIVFLRAENGDLCVGIRRAKKGIGGGPEVGWNPAGGNCPVPYGGLPAILREDDNRMLRNSNSNGLNTSGSMMGRAKVRPEAVLEAATLAANKQPFEVVYYPRASTPEFCVKASLVEASLQIRWCSGIRFKMAFETEDSSRISWFMGIVSSVHVADPLLWPNSPWRLLQVTWDEPDLLQNVRRVSPWLVELVANIPPINLSPFSPPRKKLRLPQHPDFPLDGQIPMPTFSSNPLGPGNPFVCLPESTPAGMQGARHAHYGLSLSDLHLNKMQSGLYPAGFPPLDHAATPTSVSNNQLFQKPTMSESVSCLLSMASSNQSSKKPDDEKTPHQLVLFGQKILTEQQISLSSSGDTVSPVLTGNYSSDGNADKVTNFSDGSGSAPHHERSSCERFQWYRDNRQETEAGLEIGHCKVFMESEDVGRTINLSLLGSYDELFRKLADMFGIEKSEMLSHVLYRDITGAVKHIGDEPFSNFARTARRLTILMDSSSDNVGV
ncbi:PB1 domain [Sesbania bispinosa]|nr:PB1 domain [Sesbania bispinosa]